MADEKPAVPKPAAPDAKPASPKAEALAKDLKDALAKRRIRPWKWVLVALVLSVLSLAFFAWWMYRPLAPPPLQVVALDVLATTAEPLEVRAQLLASPDDASPRPLQGCKVLFHEPPPLFAKPDKPHETATTSDPRGRASAPWPTPTMKIAEFQASSVEPAARPSRHTDQGHIFVREPNVPLLLVDADETLGTDAQIDKASPTLQNAAKDGWLIAYLTLSADNPADFRKARERLFAQAKLPRGPILGRFHAANIGSADTARSELLLSLRKRFRGTLQAVVATPEAARLCKDAGVPTILLGAAVPPEGVPRFASWSDLPLRLKQ